MEGGAQGKEKKKKKGLRHASSRRALAFLPHAVRHLPEGYRGVQLSTSLMANSRPSNLRLTSMHGLVFSVRKAPETFLGVPRTRRLSLVTASRLHVAQPLALWVCPLLPSPLRFLRVLLRLLQTLVSERTPLFRKIFVAPPLPPFRLANFPRRRPRAVSACGTWLAA